MGERSGAVVTAGGAIEVGPVMDVLVEDGVKVGGARVVCDGWALELCAAMLGLLDLRLVPNPKFLNLELIKSEAFVIGMNSLLL